VLWAAIRRTARLATLTTLLACLGAGLVPSGAGAFAKAIWGPLIRNGVNQFPMYHRLGVSIYQLDLNWNDVAPTRPAHATNPSDPAYHWPVDVQTALSLAGTYHMRVLLQVNSAPAWADGGNSGDGWAPLHAADYAAFIGAAARKYPTVHLWMVWGEPTKLGTFQPLTGAEPGQALTSSERSMAHLYARMLDASYVALKRLSRRNLVIGGDTYTTGALDPLQWISNLKLPNGRPPRMDMYGHNPFSYNTPTFHGPPTPFDEVQFSDLHELARWIDHYLHRGLPLFLSEWTIPTAPDDTFNFYVDPPVAGRWVTDAMRLSRQWKRIYSLGWVNVYDDLPTSSGGLLTQNGTPKPSYYSFEHG
jgi:hypothetical protein